MIQMSKFKQGKMTYDELVKENKRLKAQVDVQNEVLFSRELSKAETKAKYESYEAEISDSRSLLDDLYHGLKEIQYMDDEEELFERIEELIEMYGNDY